MRIVIPRESVAGEHRTSATPETVKKMIRLGAEVAIESGAGAAVGFTDSVYTELGAEIVTDRAAQFLPRAQCKRCQLIPQQRRRQIQ